MKIRKTLVVCPESRRSEIVAVLFPSSTSFPETKTLKRIKKENMVFHVYKFFSPEMCRLSHSDLFWKDAKTLPGCLFSGHPLLVHLCICLREDINSKKTFSFWHWPNHLNPPPMTPIRATWSFFFGRQKRRFSAYYRTK